MSTDFTELELNEDVTDMDGEEAKQTLAEFMEAHQKNQSAYDAAVQEQRELETEYEEKLEEKEERIAEFKQERAEEAAEYVNIPAGLLADKFSFSEIEQIIEEGAEFSEESEEANEADEDEPITTFADREEKGRTEGGGERSQYRQRAKQKLGEHGIPTGGN
jgi:hypothetical protein